MSASAGFLRDLYGPQIPEGLHVALWERPTRQSTYLNNYDDAARFEERPDVYVTACLLDRTRPTGARAKGDDAAAIPGVWADIDVAGGPGQSAKKKAAPDRDAALEVANSVLHPTLLVDSGYGIQGWWLLPEPWRFAEQREQAGRILRGWQTLLRDAAKAAGFSIDSTHDFARLMRLPGTTNGKGDSPVPVTVIEDDGPRYELEELAEPSLRVATVDENGTVAIDVQLPFAKLETLRDNDDMFRKTWDQSRRDRTAESWSQSEYDMAIASMAARYGWSDEELAALVREYRKLRVGQDDEKATRADYLSRTIRKARAGVMRERREEQREEALDELAAASENGNHMPTARTMELFNQVIGRGAQERAPKIRDLIQFGTDPDSTRYEMITETGQEVNVGGWENLASPRKLAARLGPALGYVMPKIKEDERWEAALQQIVDAADVRTEPEDIVIDWVRRYITDLLGGDRNEAIRAGMPFEENGMVHVKPAELAKFARSSLRERVQRADLHPLLRAAGFEQRSVHYEAKNGKRSTASYWAINKEEVE